MHLNLRKIDERIQKLQEIKRIAADPELVAMLFEFIGTEEERKAVAPPLPPPPSGKDATVFAPNADDVSIVNQVVNGTESTGTSLWGRKK